jgi:hypothetical protein
MSQLDLENDLKKYRRQVEEAKKEVSRLEGSKQTIFKRLKEEFGYSSTEEAEKKLIALKKERDKAYKSLEEKMAIVKKHFGVANG